MLIFDNSMQFKKTLRYPELAAAEPGEEDPGPLLSPEAWRNYSAFIGKLDDAIGVQRKVVDQSRERTAEGQQAWLAQRTRLKAFDTLSQRHQSEVARSESRQEQKRSDEHAARRGNEDA